MVAPEVMRDRIGLAEHHHAGVPGLATQHQLGQRRAPFDAVEQARQRPLVPAPARAHLLEVRERHSSDGALHLGVEARREDEGAVDGAGDRTVEPAHHHAVHRLRRVGRGHGEDRHAPPRRGQPRPQGRRATLAAVHEADVQCARHALDEIEHAVPARVDAGDQGRPGGERRRRHGRSQRSPRPGRHQAREHGQVAGGRPGRDEVQRRAVQPDHQQSRAHGTCVTSGSRGPAGGPW